MAAQIFAAVAASLSGPATSRNCMPSPLLLSLTTMTGRSVANEAVDFDLRSPRHSARRPLSELVPPTSTPNSVRCTACWAAAACDSFASGLSTDGADAVTSGLGGVTGSGSISFPAAESGGAMIDFDAMSGVAGVAAAFEIPCAGDEAATAACSRSAVRGFSGGSGYRRRDRGHSRSGARALRGRPSFRRWGRRGSRWRRCRSRCRILPRDRAGHGIQPLFQDGDPGIQPVAIAVEGIDSGCQPPGSVLALPGERLDLLRLPHPLGCANLVPPPHDRGLLGK